MLGDGRRSSGEWLNGLEFRIACRFYASVEDVEMSNVLSLRLHLGRGGGDFTGGAIVFGLSTLHPMSMLAAMEKLRGQRWRCVRRKQEERHRPIHPSPDTPQESPHPHKNSSVYSSKTGWREVSRRAGRVADNRRTKPSSNKFRILSYFFKIS